MALKYLHAGVHPKAFETFETTPYHSPLGIAANGTVLSGI